MISFDQACELARAVAVNGAIKNFERCGEVRPMSFVLGTKDPRTGRMLPSPTLALVSLDAVAHSKDAVRALQQEVCDRMGAIAHIYVTEGWSVTLEADGYSDPYDQRESLSEHPDREEVVIVTLEHKDGSAMWRIPILRDGSKPTLGPLQEDLTGTNMGRMTGYVRKQVEA